MITRKELQDFARLKGLGLGNAEKDYLIDVALLSISRNTKNELIFKGGTCLYKFHKLNRFSEDIDFSAVAEFDIDLLISNVLFDFKKFGIIARVHQRKEPYNSVLLKLRVEGPLYSGNPASYASVGIDINKMSKVFLDPQFLSYNPLYQELSQISLLCMQPQEIFAEKVRAMMTRQRARDLFDLHFLLQSGVLADVALIKGKMEYYGTGFDLKELIARLPSFKASWEKELGGFTVSLPPFENVRKYVAEKLKELYG